MENKLDLDEIRSNINLIDKEIVKLLEGRFNLVINVGQYKKLNNKNIFDAEREKIVIEKSKEYLNNKSYEQYLEKIFLEIMNTCKNIQKEII
jgi:monofunctional chorismate mutase